ncbi:unnamed protein product [Rotaria sordida]|uniref:Uncharacterized protein n=1 Tax=Rotaria sordida TaxID=392033 RepID=A0A814HFF8_9BILA|nr:unnamed protein product [Rotaria sordida]
MHLCSKSAYAIASACATLVPLHSSIKSSEQSIPHILQNYLLVWLDANIDVMNNCDCRNIITILQQIVNSVNTFTTVEECISFIRSIKEETIFLIISGSLGQTAIHTVHDISQISSIYIFCENTLDHELWIHKWPKIRNVFMETSLLCEALKQAAQEYDRNTISISFIEMNNETSNQNLNELHQSFIYIQILKNIVSTIKFKQQDFIEFIIYYRKKVVGNITELKNINKFEREYRDNVPIWWYTYPCFLYSMLNHALRTMDVVTIIKMGFFIGDLHHYITQLYSKQKTVCYDSTSFIVYRGQGISERDFEQLKKTENQILSFNNFLFTSKNRDVGLKFARQAVATSNLVGILFVITIDPSIDSIPYANIRDVSYNSIEEDFLFSMNSMFRVGQLTQINNSSNICLWQMELTLINNTDLQVHALTEHTVDMTIPYSIGWYRLSELLIKQGQFNKAQQVCDTVINQTSDDGEKGFLYYQYGLIKFHQGEYVEANSYYYLSLKILQKTFSPEHIDVAMCYNEIGLVYEKLNKYSKALSFLDTALEIYEKNLPTENDPILMNLNKNIARIYFQKGDYSKSILYYEKIIEIYNNNLSPKHPDIIASYKNIASVYEKMNDYPKAISSLEKIISIHSDMAELYNNIGSLYEKSNELSIALSYYEKALEIYEETLSSNHSELAACHKNIGRIYFQRDDYLRALSSYEEAHEIYRKIFPSNHPQLADSYTCHGAVYKKMGNYMKALLYYEKAWETYQNIYPLNHLDLATAYNNIGSVYFQMGIYSVALSYYEGELEIYQKNLSQNFSDLTFCYINIGDIYDKMDIPMKAILFYKSALDIGQRSSPVNHLCLEQCKENIEKIQKKL